MDDYSEMLSIFIVIVYLLHNGHQLMAPTNLKQLC